MRLQTLSLLALAAACAPNARTIPIVSVGNTGCKGSELAVFDYNAQVRSWTAVCGGQIFACSVVGGGTRCAPAQPKGTDAEALSRAALLRTLPPERAEPFITKDVMAYERTDFERMVALAGLVSVNLLSEITDADLQSPVFVILPPEKAAQAAKCTNGDVARVEASEQGKELVSVDVYGSCISALLPGVPVPPNASDRTLLLLSNVNEADLQARRASNAAAQQALLAAAPVAVAASAPAPAAASVAVPETSAVEAEMRAALDAHAGDMLACVSATRVLIDAVADADGQVSITVHDRPASDSAQGCARAALGPLKVSAGPASVLHLLRSEAPSEPASPPAVP